MPISVVHFPHPGQEPTLAKGARELPWNVAARPHRRKFLYATGMYRSNPEAPNKTGPLAFWGEWEPESRPAAEWQDKHPTLPATAWKPFWRAGSSYAGLHNTDPFVFGGPFLYGNCRQYTHHMQTPTQLLYLEPGSAIVFGSSIEGVFVLDTVFVVRDATPYFIDKAATLTGQVPAEYFPVTLTPTAQHPDISGVTGVFPAGFRLYKGATPDTAVDHMFSFAPCLPNDGGDARFERPAIALPGDLRGLINPKSWQNFQSTVCERAGARQVWEAIVEQVLEAGRQLGVHVDMPEEDSELAEGDMSHVDLGSPESTDRPPADETPPRARRGRAQKNQEPRRDDPFPACPPSFEGKLGDFLDEYVAPALPSPAATVAWHEAVSSWALNDSELLLIRKTGAFRHRGTTSTEHGLPFTVSDNEAAVWAYMQCFDGEPPADIATLLREQRMTIAYALTQVEGAVQRWKTIGRARRAQVFADAGWKHCHLVDAAPRGRLIGDAAELRQRAMCLISPLNHVPMPSPRRYSMSRDWGESPDVLDFIVNWLRQRYEQEPAAAEAFRAFLEMTGARGAAPASEPRISFAAKNPNEIVELDEPTPEELLPVYVSSDDSIASFAKGVDVGSFESLLERLRRWIDQTEEEVVGNSPNFGGTPWIHFSVSGVRCRLNADTKRSGVAEVLQRSNLPGFRVGVGLNNRGKCNKLLFNGEAVPGFFAYTASEQIAPTELQRVSDSSID